MSNELMEFIEVLLEDPEDDHVLTEFFDSFGTHAILSVEMGDKFVATTSFNRKEYDKVRHHGGHMKFSAEFGVFSFVDADGWKSESGFKSDKKEKGHSKMEAESMYTIGTKLPKGKNLKERLDNWVEEQ
jgi:hypothetical protein